MNTKAAVILMIGLLGSPVAYNFTQAVADDWVFYGKIIEHPSFDASVGTVLNRRTGQRFQVYDVMSKHDAIQNAIIAPPVAPPVHRPE